MITGYRHQKWNNCATMNFIKLNRPIKRESFSATMMVNLIPVVKEKPRRKNSEKRKEKSRKAARERRSQESKIFDQIEELLPVSSKSLQHLDKASLVRVAINYLKIRSLIEPFVGDESSLKDSFSLDQSSLNNSLNGFVIVMSKDGDIIYLSDSVEHHLGLNNVELLGQSIYDYSHPCDHEEIKTLLEPLTNACHASKFLPKPSERARKSFAEAKGETIGPFFIRIKSKVGIKGRNLNLKSANYKVVKLAGRMVDLEVASPENAQMIGSNYRHYLIATGELIQHPNRIEMPLPNDVFMSKHDPGMKFTYVDDSIEKLFGFSAEDLVGTSFYQYFDASDFKTVNKFFKTLFAKGQCDTGYYKFLVKTGGYRWISTQATVIKEPNSNQPQSIILINRIISGVENAHLITSNVQNLNHAAVNSAVALVPIVKSRPILPVSATASVLKPKFVAFEPAVEPSFEVSDVLADQVPTSSTYEIVAKADKQNVSPGPPDYCQSILPQFTSSTETVLAPKTADMESGFLVFTDDNKGMTILTDADDLTHLAPDAGDLCVPMLPEMDFNDLSLFDDIFLNSTSFNLNSNTNIFSEDDLINNFANIDSDKLKLDVLDGLNLETENTSHTTKKFNNHSTGNNNNNNNNFLEINEKEMPSMKSINFDQQYPLSNDPFLSFTNQNDEPFLPNLSKTRSDCSLTDPYSSTSNSPTNSSSSSSMQYLPKSTSCEEITNKLTDSADFVDDKDLDMRAPFIPIDDDFLLSDLSYSDSNIDDLFNWISNGGYNQCTNINANGKQHFQSDLSHKSNGESDKTFKSKQPNSQTLNKNGGGCLEALLQNDELVCNLKNKMYSSNQILNRQQMNQLAFVQNSVPQKTITQAIQSQTTSAMKRKNSNILIYTTLANSGDKKFKNIVLSADAIGDSKLEEKSNIHHFVLTKNNELIPKASFANQLSNFRVSSKRVLESATDSLINNISLSSTGSSDSDSSQLKENLFSKKSRPELEKTHSNSVLLNLLVSGADLPNGYDIMRNYQASNKRDNHIINHNNTINNSHMMTTNGLPLSFRH